MNREASILMAEELHQIRCELMDKVPDIARIVNEGPQASLNDLKLMKLMSSYVLLDLALHEEYDEQKIAKELEGE